MGNESQVSIVKTALDAELGVKELGDSIQKLNSATFNPEPQKPKNFVRVERKYPEVQSNLKFWPFALIALPFALIALCFGPIAWIIVILCYVEGYKHFKQRVEKDKERKKMSPEYQAQVRDLNRQYDLIDASEYQRWFSEKKEYDEVLIPNYMKEKAEWTQKRAFFLSKTQKHLDKAQENLNNFYLTTRLIPSNYHNIAALTYIYNYMSTSQYDLKEAIEKYEQYLASVREQQYQSAMLKAQNEQAEAAWQTRDIAEQSKEIAEKARREQNLANLVHTVQNHTTNELLRK